MIKSFPKLRRYSLLWALLFAFCARTAFILFTQSYNDPATWEFGRIAAYLADGKGYALWRWDGNKYTQAYLYGSTPLPSGYMPPLYPLLLAGCYKLLGKSSAAYLLLQGLQAALGAMTCWLVYLLAGQLGDIRIRVPAAWLCGLYPPLVYAASTMHPINFYVPIYLAVVYLTITLLHSDERWAFFALAIGSALLVMFRAEALLYVIVFYIRIGWTRRKIDIKSSRLISSFIVFLMLLSPWTLRNLYDLGQAVPATTTCGYNLWRGNNPDATGTGRSLEGVDEPTPADIEAEISAILPGKDFELQMDDVFMRRALHFIRAEPLSVIVLALRKQLYFWVGDLTHPLARTPYYLIPTAGLALLACISIFPAKPQNEDWHVLCLAVLLPALTASVFFVLPRYRMFIDPLLMIPAIQGAMWLHKGLVRVVKRPRVT